MQSKSLSIRKLCDIEGGIKWSEKTIRRACKSGEINPILLEALAKRLDVAPDFLRGTYYEFAELAGKDCNELGIEAILKKQMKPEKFPYDYNYDENSHYEAYITNLLMIHKVSRRQFSEMPYEQQKGFKIEIENAVCDIIQKYFTQDYLERSGLPDLYNIRDKIQSDGKDVPEKVTSEKIKKQLDMLKDCLNEN